MTLGAGQTSVELPVGIADDMTAEETEDFSVVLSDPVRVDLVDDTAVVTITDDDDGGDDTGLPPTLTITAAELVEGDSGSSNLPVTVVADAASTSDATVRVTTTDGTATAGEDYLARDLVVTLPAGATSVTVDVPVLGDLTQEGDETFDVSLSEPDGAVLGTTTTATATIIDDDQPTVFVSDSQVKEPNKGERTTRLTVELLEASIDDVVVTLSTADFDAVAGEDYVALDGVEVVIPAGKRKATLDVTVLADDLEEADEAFLVTIDHADGADVADANSLVIIRE